MTATNGEVARVRSSCLLIISAWNHIVFVLSRLVGVVGHVTMMELHGMWLGHIRNDGLADVWSGLLSV